MKSVVRVLAITLAGVIALGWLGNSAPRQDAAAVAEEPVIERVGYFKSDQRDRVMAFRSEVRLSEAQARAFFEDVFRTKGAAFRGVVYSGSSVALGDNLTAARGIARAFELTVEPPFDQWDWMFIVNPAGEESLKRNN